MNIKEIALKVAEERFPQLPEEVLDFAEALVAELAKGNKPVMVLFQHEDTGRTTSIEPQRASDFGRINKRWINCGPLFSIPPTAEQVEQETAEAIAAYFGQQPHVEHFGDNIAEAIRRGAWKEFKK